VKVESTKKIDSQK
jgi:hypothetical protein